MKSKVKKNILVTGSHRSGSTWLGKVLATSPGVHYVHEPFNISVHSESTPLHYWFEYISKDTPIAFQQKVKQYVYDIMNVDYRETFQQIRSAHSLREIRGIVQKTSKQQFAKKYLIKDPIAILSAEWVAGNLDAKVIVLIRHPAAFAASLKVKNWSFEFEHFLNQKELMNEYLSPFKEAIETQTHTTHDIIDQAILLWNCIHHVIGIYRQKHKDWIFVKHEDLSIHPLEEFYKIFMSLGLTWHEHVESFIKESTHVVKSSEYNLSAKENIFSWKKRLSQSDIQRVKLGTQEISKLYYEEQDW